MKLEGCAPGEKGLQSAAGPPTTEETSPTTEEKPPTTEEMSPTIEEESPTIEEASPTTEEESPTVEEDRKVSNNLGNTKQHFYYLKLWGWRQL